MLGPSLYLLVMDSIISWILIKFLLGTGTVSFSGDGGKATSATLNQAERVFGTTAGHLYLSDCVKHYQRR